MITISTITPVYCGEKYLQQLVNELEICRNEWQSSYPDLKLVESIFVLDDPIDNSEQILKQIESEKDWVKVIVLSKNAGQHAATMAGILYSVGDWVFTIDEDLQHHPRHFMSFLKNVANETCDICYANNIKATHNSIIRDQCALLFKKVVGLALGNQNIKFFNSFRLIRGQIARSASAIAGNDAYFDIVLSWYTNKLKVVNFEFTDLRNNSKDEKSGYSLWGLIKHAKRMVLTSNIKILRGGIIIGLLAFLLSILITIYALVAWYIYKDTEMNRGWYSTISSILFFGGLNSLLLGLLLESMSHILLNSQGKPSFYQINRDKDLVLKKILQENN